MTNTPVSGASAGVFPTSVPTSVPTSAASTPAAVSGLVSSFSAEEDQLNVSIPAEGIVLIQLANPDQRNAMSMRMTQAWGRLMAALAGDRQLRCVVVTGVGSAFCSGGDTSWIGSDPDASISRLRDRMEPFYRTWLALKTLPVPVVAGINGPAVGAGACLALAADIRFAAESARFSMPFLKLGMHPGMAATFLLPEVVGVAAARDLLFTGRSIDAAEMVRLGVASRVLPEADFQARLLTTAERVAQTAPIATRLTKAGLADGGFRSLEESIRWEALAQPVTLATADLSEGLAAARERRRPEFRGE